LARSISSANWVQDNCVSLFDPGRAFFGRQSNRALAECDAAEFLSILPHDDDDVTVQNFDFLAEFQTDCVGQSCDLLLNGFIVLTNLTVNAALASM